MSIVSSIFRVASGWMADMKFINRRVLFCAAYFVCAFAVSSLYLCGSYESIVPICIIYSMSSGTYDQTIKIATPEYVPTDMFVITKKCLFKYIKNFTTENRKFSDKKSDIFSDFCSKHRLWVLVRTASPRRFY